MALVSSSLCRTAALLSGAFLFSIIVQSATAAEGDTLRIGLGGDVSISLVRIEPGTFPQGSPGDAAGRRDDETPRTVTLTRPFFLGKYPVTRGQFARFVSETNYRTESEIGTSGGFGWDGSKVVQRRDFNWKNPGFPQTDAHPVTLVTYKDAKAFLTWLSRKAGRNFALPTEAQWEYACRAGSTTAYAHGDNPAGLAEVAWFKDNSAQGTQPVGGKPLNAWGLGDMPGNVWEWCEDWFGPYSNGAAQDPVQTNSTLSDKPRRVLRGGSWLRPAADLRSAARYRNDAASRNPDNGFRAMTFDVATPATVPPPSTTTAPKPVPLLETTERANPDRPQPAAMPDHSNDGEHTPPPVSGSFHFGLGGIAIVLALIGILVAIVRAVARSGAIGVQPGNMAVTNSGPVRTRIVDDGFWIESATLPPGSVVACRYIVGGQREEKSVVFQGGSKGQFVFTGSRPENVSIVVQPAGSDIDDPDLGRAAGLASAMYPPPVPNPPPIPARPRPQPQRPPPAY